MHCLRRPVRTSGFGCPACIHTPARCQGKAQFATNIPDALDTVHIFCCEYRTIAQPCRHELTITHIDILWIKAASRHNNVPISCCLTPCYLQDGALHTSQVPLLEKLNVNYTIDLPPPIASLPDLMPNITEAVAGLMSNLTTGLPLGWLPDLGLPSLDALNITLRDLVGFDHPMVFSPVFIAGVGVWCIQAESHFCLDGSSSVSHTVALISTLFLAHGYDGRCT